MTSNPTVSPHFINKILPFLRYFDEPKARGNYTITELTNVLEKRNHEKIDMSDTRPRLAIHQENNYLSL